MKKLFPSILIVLIFVQLLAPFTIGSGVNNNLQIRSNNVEASDDTIKVTASSSVTDTTVTVSIRAIWGNNGWRATDPGVTVTLLDRSVPAKVISSVMLTPSSPKPNNLVDLTEDQWTTSEKSITPKPDTIQTGSVTFSGLKPETTYGITTIGIHGITSWWSILTNTGVIGSGIPVPDISTTTIASPDPLEVTTNKAGNTTPITAGQQVAANDESILPECDLLTAGTWGGCIGRILYSAIFKPTSYIFSLTGRLLDVSVDYSTKDTSYRSDFVVKGWGVVRDFCNMFFIFILLYIAFGTILNLHGVKTKEMIINVVIIGLLLNFSLFATQIIIDTSNILTRVFYNSQSITVGPKINGVVQDQRGSQGEIKLSEALVSKINPQKLLLEAYKANNIQTKETTTQDTNTKGGISATTFILVVILASIINVVGIITFLMSSLIFIARVIGLWMAMIFAPLAFFSYTIPAMQEWDVVGWKRWWPETLKLAFLAPVFVFFMYLIIKFLQTGLGLFANDSATGLDFILGIFVPFIFIMVLLTKAKDIAKDMSGKIGQSITNGIAAVGGVALGAGIGGLAMASRASIGRAGSAIANSDWAKRAESKGVFGARTLRTISSGIGKGSLDIRGVKIAGKGIEDATGLTNTGRAKEGGFEKIRAEKTMERAKRAADLKTSEDSEFKQNLNKEEENLQRLLKSNSHTLEVFDKRITATRQNLQDAAAAVKANPTEENKNAQRIASETLAELKAHKAAIKNAKEFTTTTLTATASDKAGLHDYRANTTTGVVGTGRSINNLEDEDIPHAHEKLEHENKNRAWDYANYISSSKFNRVANFISSGGQYSRKGENEAVHKIRMEVKVSGGDKSHKSESHAPAKAPVHAEPKAEAKHDDGHGGGGHGH